MAVSASELSTQPLQQYLTFSLDKGLFGISILHIREIIEYGEVTSVPMVPSYIQGVINLRGAVVPIVNLALRFGRAAVELNKRSCIVIIEVMNHNTGALQQIGLMVD